MSRTLELPETVYAALSQAAQASDLSPVAWIAARLPKPSAPTQTEGSTESSPKTLAERFAGRVGHIGSGGRECLSEDTGEKFSEHLEEKRRAGHL
jgi:hypothetical protein